MSDGCSEFGGGNDKAQPPPKSKHSNAAFAVDTGSDRHELAQAEAGQTARQGVECWNAALGGSQRASKASEARKQCRAGSSGIEDDLNTKGQIVPWKPGGVGKARTSRASVFVARSFDAGLAKGWG